MRDCKGRDHGRDGKFAPDLIQTSQGPMTRRQIAELVGIPLNTVHSRIYRKVSEAELFAPKKESCSRPQQGKRGRPDARRTHDESNYVETWEQRKQRRLEEKVNG